MIHTLKILMKNNIHIDAKDLDRIAADAFYRLELYDVLKEIGKEKMFPVKFLQPQQLAESALIEYLEKHDEIQPDRIEFIKTKNVDYEKQKMKLYIFKYGFSDDNTWYVGVSGPYPTTGNEVLLRGKLTFTADEAYDPKTLTQVIENGLKEQL
jgi:hypothetical protein